MKKKLGLYFTLSLINLFVSSVTFASSDQEETDSIILAKVNSRFEQYKNEVSKLEERANELAEKIARVEDDKLVLAKELSNLDEFLVNDLMRGTPYFLAYFRSHFNTPTNLAHQSMLREKASKNINLSDLPEYHNKAVRTNTKTSVNELIFVFENLGGRKGTENVDYPSVRYVSTDSPLTPKNKLEHADKIITAIKRRTGLESQGTSIRRKINFDGQDEGTTSSITTSSSIIQPTSSVEALATLVNHDANAEPGTTE